ncbi:MAG: isoleucine--tRNA ligase [Pseudomonadota bacterium]
MSDVTTPTEDAAAERDYRETLFLPKTEFPMRGGLPKAEPNWIARWDKMNLYERLRADAETRNARPFILHDGPPYANGHIHLGTAMNKIVKDIIVRSRQMTGFDASYLPGWDCHGLPIEWKVEEAFRAKGKTKDDVDAAEFRKACRDYAAEWVAVQAKEFRRLGVEGEWDDPYLTMAYESEAAIVGEFLRVAMGGLLVRGAKPIMWSPVERTALAEAEVEYHDRKVPTIWARFKAPDAADDVRNADVVIWTTTPWTIPANQAVAFNPGISYGVYEVEALMSEEELGFAPYAQPGDRLILADALADDVMGAAKATKFARKDDVDPAALGALRHPLAETDPFWAQPIPLLPGDHVTDDAGTGFVHSAPAHGEEDFEVCMANGFKASDIRQIVDQDGCYTSDVPRFAGLDIIRTSGKKRGQPGKANDEVIKALAESGNLLARGVTTIRDAHSWRSKAPVIRRATPQWFIAMDKPVKGEKTLRDLALAGIDQADFTPKTGRNRLQSMVESRPDWLVSRQRNWGVPLTIFVNAAGQPHTEALNPSAAAAVNARILEAVRAGGVEAWFSSPKDVLLGNDADPADWEKVTDVLDVWFDSGTTHAFALRARGVIDEATGQADVYMEGSDQHRGWFQSSLLEGCATRGIAPYKHVVTHGFIVDSEGKKMSKSIGNTIEPQEIADKYGIEILRLWTASSDFTEDLRISDEIIKGVTDTYRRLRNTLRYLLGALDGFEASEATEAANMPGLERWALHRMSEMDAIVREAYAAYDFKRAMAALSNFCAVDLSAVYFDIRKDSLYCDAPDDPRRRACRTVMDLLLDRLLTWLAPVMPFTTEEAFLMSGFADRADSVHLLQMPETPDAWRDDALAECWSRIFQVRRVVTGALEIERREKRIGSSLEAAPEVYVTERSLLEALDGEDLAELSITSDLHLFETDAPGGAFTLDDTPGVGVVFRRAEGRKCARSWKYFDPGTADPDYPDVTPRDALVVKQWDARHAQ